MDDFLFRLKISVPQQRVRHSIGFEIDLNADLFATHDRKIDGRVGRCKSIRTSAVFRDDARILLGFYGWRPLEHHVFEKMRQAALAVFLIARTDAIPHLESHGRALVVFEQEHFEAVVENDFADVCGMGEAAEDGE